MEAWLGNTKKSALVEANLIQGGSLELTFATTSDERHENAYVRVFYPGVSVMSHPFSTFSRDSLRNAELDDLSSTTLTILLQSKGPFTKGLKRALFPSVDTETDVETNPISNPQALSLASSASSMHHKIQFDSYYAGSFDWVDGAMCHDEILIVAGGVGIVPFLEFLPALQQRIRQASQDTESVTQGPTSVTLHWYCRQVGSVSLEITCPLKLPMKLCVGNYLNSACQGRLKVHIHLTSFKSDSLKGGVDLIMENAPDVEDMAKKNIYGATSSTTKDCERQRPVQDARYKQSLGLRLLMPILFVCTGTFFHWWWYANFVVADQFRRNNLIIHSHAIIFSLVISVVVSVLVEVYYYRREHNISIAGYDEVKDLELVAQVEDTTTT